MGMPYVNQRWLGGMLTNFATVSKRIGKMKELEELDFDDVAASGLTKKELLQQRRKKDKLAKTLSGIRDMGKLPQAVWIVDTNKEHLAIDEARKLKIPVVGILDTNCDPDEVDFADPGQRRRDPLRRPADPRGRRRRGRGPAVPQPGRCHHR